MNIQNEFPTPIGTFQIDNSESLNKGLTELLLNLKKEDNQQRSMVGGYHTKEDLLSLDNPFIKEFHKLISEQILDYHSQITKESFGQNSKMVSWGMIYGAGHYSKPHTHPLADISSAYYCKVPKDIKGGTFEYVDPRPNAKYDINFTHNSVKRILPEEGHGIIFPGWLDHYVVPHYNDEERICITTNVFIDHANI
jgi:uncharacterized protein (TIGR02466 family)